MDGERSAGVLRRRGLLASAPAVLAAGVAMASPLSALANIVSKRLPGTRRMLLRQPNTDEELDITYMRDERFDPGALAAIDHLMRDWHTGEVIEIDRRLLDLVCALHLQLAPDRPVQVISAYRTRKTNEWLRRRGRKAAKNSLHIEGRAVDIRIEGVRLRDLRDTARGLAAGGVGYYPRSRFIHIDTGAVRYW